MKVTIAVLIVALLISFGIGSWAIMKLQDEKSELKGTLAAVKLQRDEALTRNEKWEEAAKTLIVSVQNSPRRGQTVTLTPEGLLEAIIGGTPGPFLVAFGR